jgi:glycosyltransferase involved in cell wall biosynthesis
MYSSPAKGQNLRVLILSHMYPRQNYPVGGIFVHEQARALRARGIDARVATGDPSWVQTFNPRRAASALRSYLTRLPAWTTWDTVPAIHFPYLCGFLFRPSIHTLTYASGFRRMMVRLYREFPFDLVHAHTSFLDGAAGLMASRVYGRPLVITEHTGPFDLLTRNAFMRYRTRRSVRAANRVFAVSNSLKQAMLTGLELTLDRIDVLPNGIDPGVFYPGAEDKPRTSDHVRALWVGHHVEVKRVDNLVRAFARALQSRPSLHLSLLGDGPDRQKIEALATELGLTDHVEFLPGTDRAGVARAMRAHDFVCVSSATETFSLVTLEALGCGIPVLSTACGGPEDLITQPWLGSIVSNNVDGLTSGLIEMAGRTFDSDAAKRHAYVRDSFSWDAIAGRLIVVYQQLAAS